MPDSEIQCVCVSPPSRDTSTNVSLGLCQNAPTVRGPPPPGSRCWGAGYGRGRTGCHRTAPSGCQARTRRRRVYTCGRGHGSERRAPSWRGGRGGRCARAGRRGARSGGRRRRRPRSRGRRASSRDARERTLPVMVKAGRIWREHMSVSAQLALSTPSFTQLTHSESPPPAPVFDAGARLACLLPSA